MSKQRSKLRASAYLLGALLASTVLTSPASAAPARGADDGVFSILGVEFCIGERAGVDCDVTLPQRWFGELAPQDRTDDMAEPKKLELLGLTMCIDGSAQDCDLVLREHNA